MCRLRKINRCDMLFFNLGCGLTKFQQTTNIHEPPVKINEAPTIRVIRNNSAKMNGFFHHRISFLKFCHNKKLPWMRLRNVIMFKRQTTAMFGDLCCCFEEAPIGTVGKRLKTALRLLPIWQIRDYWTKVSTYFIQTTSALNEWHAIFCNKPVFDTLALSSASCSNVFTVWTVNHSNWHVSFNTFYQSHWGLKLCPAADCICICIILM